MRISDWSSDVCSSDLLHLPHHFQRLAPVGRDLQPGAAPCVDPALDQITGRTGSGGRKACDIGPGARARAAMEHHRAITGPKAVDFGQRHIARAGDMFARMFVGVANVDRSEEHTSELQSLMRISYAVFCLKKKQTTH